MTETIRFSAADLNLVIACDDAGRPCILHLGLGEAATLPKPGVDLMLHQVQADQLEQNWIFDASPGDRHGSALPGVDIFYRSHDISERDGIRELRILSEGDGLRACAVFQAYGDSGCLRCWQEVENIGPRSRILSRVDSCFLGCLPETPRDELIVHRCANAWGRELSWQRCSMAEANVDKGTAALRCTNVGSWSSKRWLPMGALEDLSRGHCLLWQIESGGSWQWQTARGFGSSPWMLCMGGPDEVCGHWWRELKPGDRYASTPVAISAGHDFAGALAPMNDYRRALRRPSWDNEHLPVIFNDYMNCLFAQPTSEKERPLIAAAAKAGCEVYCIDAGWYSNIGQGWVDTVGLWQESADRFDTGLPALLQEIRDAGMVPGLWLELEVMGMNCPLAKQWPDECFYMRHGKRLVKGPRHHLDFRHPIVRAHCDEVIDRLVGDWGVGYIKMDYNSEACLGTENAADSLGAGLEDVIAAYHDWLDAVFARYPDLIIENCGSGGLRMDYAKLARHSIQSTSDQEDFRLYAPIAAALATGACPEQQAVWSYPKREGDLEEARFNMVNAMLGRIHQSGHLAELSAERYAAVCEGIAVYKNIRADIRQAQASWPLGLPGADCSVCAVLLSHDGRHYLAVWNLAEETRQLCIPLTGCQAAKADILYPAAAAKPHWDGQVHQLTVQLDPAPSARIYALS